MKIIAKKDFNINGNLFYNRGDEVKITDQSLIVKLNELGFIEPLTIKDIQNVGKEEIKKEIPKKENKKSVEEE